ncbi:MAG TPA: phytanoyl-CoA dioxygenase family protein [Planctomycetota bacterium]|nr:phytanoyl-CoA dioxygenase family protein [Planctomycetota bacterium]
MSTATIEHTVERHAAKWGYRAADFWEKGYAVARGVFSRDEMREIKAATDRIKALGMKHGANHRQGNLCFWVEQDPNIGTNVRGMQWGSYLEPVLEQMRRDPRMLEILKPLIGDNLRQIINQLHWKTPGSRTAIDFHADRRNRRPAEDFRDLENSYVQTALSVDPMTPENGALMVVPGSHRKAFKKDVLNGGNFSTDESFNNLKVLGYETKDLLPLYAEPGDVVLWHVDTVHGSGLNKSPTMDRCIYINGYVKAQNCMRGHWAFIQGQGVPLPPVDVPVLVQHEPIFDDLAPRTEAPAKKLYD